MLRILQTILFIRNVIITYVYVYDTKSYESISVHRDENV